MGFFAPKNTPENAIKAQIDAKLAFINDKYTEIGRFVKLKMADKIDEPEVKNLIAQIDATLEELKGLNEQLLTIRGMKLCSGCGREIPVNMAFCPNCGTKQPEIAQPVYQQPMQGAAVPMGGAQPVIQNTQGYHNHPVSPAYVPPQANPVNSTNVQPAQPVQTAAPMPEPVIPQTAVPTPQPETAPQPAPMPEPVVQPLINEERPVVDTPAQQPEPAPAPVIAAEEPAAEPVSAPVNSGFVFCSECGHKEPAGVKFCSECGTKL